MNFVRRLLALPLFYLNLKEILDLEGSYRLNLTLAVTGNVLSTVAKRSFSSMSPLEIKGVFMSKGRYLEVL